MSKALGAMMLAAGGGVLVAQSSIPAKYRQIAVYVGGAACIIGVGMIAKSLLDEFDLFGDKPKITEPLAGNEALPEAPEGVPIEDPPAVIDIEAPGSIGKLVLQGTFIVPRDGADVYRHAFSREISVQVQVFNKGFEPKYNISVAVRCTVTRSRANNTETMTTIPPIDLKPGETRQIEMRVDTGDYNSVAFEFGQGNAILELGVGGTWVDTISCYIN